MSDKLNSRLSTIRILHITLIMPPIVLYGFFFINQLIFIEDIVSKIVGILIAASSVISYEFFLKQSFISRYKSKTFEEKLIGYQSLKILQYSMIEGAAVFNVILAAGEPNPMNAPIVALLVLYYILFLRPSKSEFLKLFQLKEHDLLNTQ
ncbi:MAG TPA: hypothetical protein PK079_06915 [Leptospiraceae bacterium]|nr:hypothetical protein [Leptospiraceae bacterium]HMW05994.1 hypothetical protein [Leptospiraceae bacterium]HMX32074.1 hypothetical protein [Leptospiraceae bacterium]HMY32348.1 hypothetical protein [Leptospiraceae bacterium]HMZ62450.1 hypothetical protein [Leptospiraceae bacterium]